jgi:hypothetical protein
MKTIVSPNEHDTILAQWRGAEARILAFHISHKRMAICLSKPDEREFLYIVAVSSEHISGPFCWNHADVSVVSEPPNKWGEVIRRVVDKQAGFELTCSDVVVLLGPGGLPNDPFDGFIGTNEAAT